MRRVLAFYKFKALAEPELVREELHALGTKLDLKGTILLATEGVNGTVVGSADALGQLQQVLTQRFGELACKWSDLDDHNPGFYRYKVRVKPEIVSFGVAGLDVEQTAEHVSPERWHELLDDPDVLVIDTRNTYEIDIGTFPGAISPQTTNFREFPGWVEANLDPHEVKQVAMFCTGGIRCEKASAYMRQQGFAQVYQLDGGVLQYLAQVTPEHNRWDGECFVFDQRVSVDAELQQGQYEQCFACRHPLSAQDMASAHYEHGVSCPHCYQAASDDARIESLRERQRQVRLAEERGQQHIGKPQAPKPQAVKSE